MNREVSFFRHATTTPCRRGFSIAIAAVAIIVVIAVVTPQPHHFPLPSSIFRKHSDA